MQLVVMENGVGLCSHNVTSGGEMGGKKCAKCRPENAYSIRAMAIK